MEKKSEILSAQSETQLLDRWILYKVLRTIFANQKERLFKPKFRTIRANKQITL